MTKKILLADDSITIQKVVRITLADGDYNLITVDNGTEAVERARKESPDLVLADVVMPGKDGYQVCEEIKKDPVLSGIPVILLAGSFEGFDEIKGADVGADGYIIKPFESQALISKVEEMFNRPKPKPRRVEEEAAAKTTPKVQAPATAHPGELDTEVKDFMDSLSSEMEHPEDEAAPVVAEAVAEAVPEKPGAEPVAEAVPVEPVAAEPEVAQAEMVTEEELWEAEPIADEQVGAGETVMEAEPVTEEELWAEPMAEEPGAAPEPAMEVEPVAEAAPIMEETPVMEAVPEAEPVIAQEPEPVLEAPVEEPPVMEAPVEEAPLMAAEPAQAEFAAEPVFEAAPEAGPSAETYAEPVAEWEPSPEMELPAEPVSAQEPLAGPEEAPMADVQESALAPEPFAAVQPEVVPVGDMLESPPEAYALLEAQEAAPELETGVPSAQVHAKVAEAAEEIAAAAASGLSRSELVELIRATVERVAWEVVPELAEALIKERITRWEVQTQ